MPYGTKKDKQREYNKRYYQNNSAYFKENARKREKEIQKFIHQQKVGLFCQRCGNTDIRVLDFHIASLAKHARFLSCETAQ